jgi:glycosyltransferase involved in cell wall biosynthesis
MAFLETDIPIVYSTDATLELLLGYYLGFTGMSAGYLAQAREIEQRALDRSRMVLYPSEWAAASARRDYGVPASRVHVIPYGPNVDSVPPRGIIEGAKSDDVCRILFLGVSWERKGGATAYEAVRLLRARGVDARLTICGCTPPMPVDPAFTTVIPHLDKNVPAEAARLSELLLHASFLVLPTVADCFGIVFCEASAHGTPSVAPDTGGVGGAVVTGENGILLPEGSSPDEYAAEIARLFQDRARYRALVSSSRASFEQRLNWDRWGQKVSELLGTL